MNFGSEKMMLSLVTLIRSEMESETQKHEVTIPGLSQDPPPPPPGEDDTHPQTSMPSHNNSSDFTLSSSLLSSMPSSLSSQFYYSSRSVTASYSSGPQPPMSNCAPLQQPRGYPGYQALPPPPPPQNSASSQYNQMYNLRYWYLVIFELLINLLSWHNE